LGAFCIDPSKYKRKDSPIHIAKTLLAKNATSCDKESPMIQNEIPIKIPISESRESDFSPSTTSTKAVRLGPVIVGGERFAVIAGPCSIENHQQFLSCAESAKSLGAGMLRGGIFKMRTDPKSFQGLGLEALTLVKEICSITAMPIVTEVTDPRQIEKLDEYVDAYQVGTRNMYNYALLKELGQSRKGVLLKRGFSALIKEWLLASDYVRHGGNENVVLCERGIRTFETVTRNTLDIGAIAYVKKYHDLPVIADPSHGAGRADLVEALSLAAAAAGADGLLLEIHPAPTQARSDADQAIDLIQFETLMHKLEKLLPIVGRKLKA